MQNGNPHTIGVLKGKCSKENDKRIEKK